MLLFTTENNKIGDFNQRYKQEENFLNIILYVKNIKAFYEIINIAEIINILRIESLEIRITELFNIEEYFTLTKALLKTNLRYIHLVDCNNLISIKKCKEILLKCVKTLEISKFECSQEKLHTIKNSKGIYLIRQYRGKVFDKIYDINVNVHNVTAMCIAESNYYNIYFKGKLVIGLNGKIYNNESCKGNDFGSATELKCFKEIENNVQFSRFWGINKNLIEKCKDCELREICIDRRIPVEQDHSFIYSYDCNYDLRSGKWV